MRQPIYINQPAIDRAIDEAKMHIPLLTKTRVQASHLTNLPMSDIQSIIGETEVYDSGKSEQFPDASIEWIYDSKGKIHDYHEWQRLKKHVFHLYRYDVDNDGNVILSNRWLKEIQEQHTQYIEDEEIVIFKELAKATKALSDAINKTSINLLQYIEKDLSNGSYKLNSFKLYHYFQELRRTSN